GTLALINRDRGIVDNLVTRVRDVESALRDIHLMIPAADAEPGSRSGSRLRSRPAGSGVGKCGKYGRRVGFAALAVTRVVDPMGLATS
ncbi:hypothetical protein ACFYSW_30230, partial [Rhodococcus aetherivorans]